MTAGAKKAKAKRSTPSWSDVKAALADHDRAGLLSLVGDLYNLSKENRTFLHVRFAIGDDPANKYKEIISDAIAPDIFSKKGIRIASAKSAIADYVKAVGASDGEIDLMIYFVERGTEFTLDLGDIDGPFYDALLSMYGRAIKKVIALPEGKQAPFRDRLHKIMTSARHTGWGYGDGLEEMYIDAWPADD